MNLDALSRLFVPDFSHVLKRKVFKLDFVTMEKQEFRKRSESLKLSFLRYVLAGTS